MLDKMKEILGKSFQGIDISTVDENTRLVEDLGFDSLSFMMMAMEIEDGFGFKFKEMVKFETVGDVCKYLESRV